MVVIRKHESGVHDDHVVAVFKNRHVLADTVQTAEGYDPESGFGFLVIASFIGLSALPGACLWVLMILVVLPEWPMVPNLLVLRILLALLVSLGPAVTF
jgi:fatty acid desaturase